MIADGLSVVKREGGELVGDGRGMNRVESWSAVQRLQRTSSLGTHREASTEEEGCGGGRGHGVRGHEDERVGGHVGGVDGAGDHREERKVGVHGFSNVRFWRLGWCGQAI